MQMSFQEYTTPTTWFNTPTRDPTRSPGPKSISRTQHQNDAVSTDENSSYRATHVAGYDKEAMFEKPLTPSDVGKLNRLVVPKQNAEKYFPLGGGDTAGGTHLGFEDEDGKWWMFRYSYWNSSQSYVLTKGWSRYVKEKRLQAGDVVLFHRHRSDPERMFIGSRRRGSAPQPPLPYNSQPFPTFQQHRHDFSLRAESEEQMERESGGSSSNRRHVRLFGVNLECQLDNSSSSSQTTSSESSFVSTQKQAYNNYFDHYYHNHHMED